MRLWVRLRVVREPGLDDALILFSAILCIAGSICVFRGKLNVFVISLVV
jgi:hypothetical protein